MRPGGVQIPRGTLIQSFSMRIRKLTQNNPNGISYLYYVIESIR